MKKRTDPNLENKSDITELTQLKESEKLFRKTFEQAAVGIAHVRLDGNFIRINQKFCDIVGYDEKEMLKLTFQDITYPDDLESDVAKVKQLLAGEIDTYSLDKRYICKNGELTWVNLTVSLVRNNEGHPQWFVSVVKDINERKEVSEALLESETKYRELVDNSLVGVFNSTLDGKLIFVNEASVRMFDFKNVEQMLSKGPLAAWTDPKQLEQLEADLKNNGSVTNFEAERITHTGRRIHVLHSVQVQADCISGMVIDITEQKKAEKALRDREATLSTIFNAPLETILLLNLDGTVLSINESGSRRFNKSPGALIGQNIYEFMEGEVLQHRKAYIEEVIRTGKPVHFFDEREGNYFDNNIYPVFDTDGENVVSIAVFSSDITERKQVEDKFELLVKQAGDAFFILDYDDAIIDVNQEACRSLGYSRKELLKMKISQVDIEVVDKHHKGQFWETLKPGHYHTFEGVHRRKNGSSFPVEVRLGRLDLAENRFLLALARDITERKQNEEELKKRVEFQELVSGISTDFINLDGRNIDTVIDEKLKEICTFFDADRALIARMSIDGKELSNSHVQYSEQFDSKAFHALTSKISYSNFTNYLIENDTFVFSDPTEFSHWPEVVEVFKITGIKSAVSVKLNYDGSVLEMFDIVTIRNRRIWDENIIKQVKYVGQVLSNALSRKRSDEEVKKKNEFQELVSKISTKFSALSGAEFETVIHDSLGEIGKYFNSDTVRLYRLSPHGDVLKIRNMWRSEEFAPMKEMPEIHRLTYPNMAAHYYKGESVVFGKFDDSPKWPEMRKILKFFGTKAGVGVPLESDKSGVDIFAMDKVLSEHIWPEDIIKQCKAIGKVLLSAMRRREAEVKLQNSYDEISGLKNRLEQENIYLQEEIKVNKNFDTIIGQSASLNYVLHRLEQVAPTNATVLIQGETGTGKELFAHALHGESGRKDKPLINVGCASLSTTLIESEFFGHEKGAFTGADKQRIGRFELANKGTIFLDEIGELSLELQAKLLRVLQEGEIERLGSSKTIKIDVRVIAATNRNLEEEVKEGRFREDLYYRLATFKLSVPPLRDRLGDIPLLVRFFTEKSVRKFGKNIKSIPKSSMNKLENYSWPGNIRELQNTIENAIIISENQILKVEIPGSSVLSKKGKMKLKDIEQDHIIEVLKSTNWRLGGKAGAAEMLGMKRTTLYAKMKKFGIKRE